MNNSTPHTTALQHWQDWFDRRGWQPFPFQREMLDQVCAGRSGLLHAPTGSGKTLAVWLPLLAAWAARHPDTYTRQRDNGLRILWISPLRALSKDTCQACADACQTFGLPWRVELRTGDTSSAAKARQQRKMPETLITTPESLHVLFSAKKHRERFQHIEAVVVDEWHELLGTKRGVQVELALAHLRSINPRLQVWGISATVGNLDQALDVLMGPACDRATTCIVQAADTKEIVVESILPDSLANFPWAGHLGVRMIDQVLPVLARSRSTLLFCNTRAQAEIWYQALLEADPALAGQIAMHHGSIDASLRTWVEQALHDGLLKVVVCTSSLDLGVDFRPVETVVQIGGPKGVARFVQRAGRSGHGPGETSRIYFVPTHSLELIEAAALRQAVRAGTIEARLPLVGCYDVLVQYLLTLAVSDGFTRAEAWQEIRQTHAYCDLAADAFDWILDFITTGGRALFAYEAYRKAERDEQGRYIVSDKGTAQRHRLSIGTIVSDSNLTVKYIGGGRIGTVEESFISQLQPGDIFWFAGRSLELVRIHHLEVFVRRSKETRGKVPRWMGSRMPLSSQMARLLRQQLTDYLEGRHEEPELQRLGDLFAVQQRWSRIPRAQECLVEYIASREGWHLYIYPFEGRVVHEIMGTLLAWRISQMQPITFSIAMNDYGLELLSDQALDIGHILASDIFSCEHLDEDLTRSINATEMAQRRFREIARVAGLVFEGWPGKGIAARHLQASSSLIFQVFRDYEPDNLLLKQAYTEVIDYQIDMQRLREAMQRLQGQQVVLTRPPRFTPFCFPIMVDRLRERLSSEKLSDRIARMQVQLDKQAAQ
ncbi:MAG: ligase-associated DNA damage response DEXH box helicase [Bacteroidia bacterium]